MIALLLCDYALFCCKKQTSHKLFLWELPGWQPTAEELHFVATSPACVYVHSIDIVNGV
jgi:hypothetical protein